LLNLPVILVVDASRMAQSIAPLVTGFVHHDPQVKIAGVILNKVGSARHAQMLRAALEPTGIPVYGAIPRTAAITQPSRHLGLVQAQERLDLEAYLNHAADIMREHIDLDMLPPLVARPPHTDSKTRRPPAQTIAVAQDAAFAFAYPHVLRDWQSAGATLKTFSPLSNDRVPDADLIYLPGGYPELYAGQIASNTTLMNSLKNAAEHTDTLMPSETSIISSWTAPQHRSTD